MKARELSHRQPSDTAFRSVGPLADLISVQLRRVDILLTRGFVAQELNLKTGVTVCMGLIAANPGISQKELAEATGTDKSIIVSIINLLEHNGWATRSRSTVNRRRYALNLTDEGRAELDRIVTEVKRVEAEYLSAIPAEDLEYLRELLSRMHKSCMSAIESR